MSHVSVHWGCLLQVQYLHEDITTLLCHVQKVVSFNDLNHFTQHYHFGRVTHPCVVNAISVWWSEMRSIYVLYISNSRVMCNDLTVLHMRQEITSVTLETIITTSFQSIVEYYQSRHTNTTPYTPSIYCTRLTSLHHWMMCWKEWKESHLTFRRFCWEFGRSDREEEE